MARQNIPTQPSPKTTQYMNLLGVDYQSDSTEISTLRSPDMVNMISDLGGIPVKRYGYRQFGDAYEGVATIGGDTWAVKKVPQGTTPETYKICACTIDVSGGRVEENNLTELSPRTNTGEVKHVFGFQNMLYVLCEKEWIEKDTETGLTRHLGINEGNAYETTDALEAEKLCLKLVDPKYIPTVYTMYKPNGKELVTLPQGTDITGATEGVNLLTPFRRVEYCVTTETAEETVFVIPNDAKIFVGLNTIETAPFKVEVLDKDTYDWKTLTVATDYNAGSNYLVYNCKTPDGLREITTDVADGKFTLATAPYVVVTESGVQYLRFRSDNTVDVPSGVPNVRITYAPFNSAVSESAEPVLVTEPVTVTIAEATTSQAYTATGQNTTIMTVTLSQTPTGLICISPVIYYPTSTGFIGIDASPAKFFAGVATSEQFRGSDGLHADCAYDGDKTFVLTVPETAHSGTLVSMYVSSGSGSTLESRTGTVYYVTSGGSSSHTMSATPADGTKVSIGFPYTSYRKNFTAGSAEILTMARTIDNAQQLFVYAYDGSRTIYCSQGVKQTGVNRGSAYYHQYSWEYALGADPSITDVEYYKDATAYNGAYKSKVVDIYKSNAIALFDARLFGGVGVHTYYSRASEPFKIDDNFYFDIDNDVLTYTRASRYLAVITEDIGRNTIFLASGEYDNDLAMVVYSVRASNAGVGAVTAGVSGTLNDEPLFLSRTGVYGISTNYLSEKYATSRSGKINKHLCKEPNLETAIGIVHNNYFYLAINGHMYVLDGRHRDASRNGDNSYECYYFDNMPNITDMFVVDNRLLFSDGTHTYAWNDDLAEEYQYIDNAVWNDSLQRWEGEPVACKWTSKLDGDGAPHFYKVLSKKGTMITVAPPMQTGCQITIIKDAHDEYYIGRFNGSTFALSDSVMDAFTKKKIKKYKRLQFVIENKEAEPFGLISVVKTFTLGNYAKR